MLDFSFCSYALFYIAAFCVCLIFYDLGDLKENMEVGFLEAKSCLGLYVI